MLLRQKKTQGEDQNWCVILSPIPSEIDRKKVAQRISGSFSLSLDEALDLVSNTPIIILDNLTRDIASKVKDYFRAAGAETVLTNDVFQKRKCYRTVWPEPPSLAFLQDWNSADAVKEETQELQPEDALNEVRTLSGKETSSAQPSLTSIPFMNRTEREQLADEADRWRRECMKVREEMKELNDQLARAQKDNAFQPFVQPQEDTQWAESREKEMKEAQQLLEHANERYEILRQEYASARHLYEEKITALLQDAEAVKRKNAEIEDSIQMTQRERQSAQERLLQKEKEWQFIHDQEGKAKKVLEQKIAAQSEEIAKLNYQFRQAQESTQMFQRTKEELELAVNTQAEQVLHWRDQYDRLSAKLSGLTQELHNEKTLREALEIRQRELEKNYERSTQEFEEKNRSIKDWEVKYLETDRQLAQLREAFENQEKTVQYQLKQLESRDRELDAMRRQVRDLNSQNEHRETIQKRTMLANQLLEKEGALKKLVQDQHAVEAEIRSREESMRAILAQQELVEKEIIEAKQTQRHLAELAKREQKVRRPGAPLENSSADDTQND